MFYEFGAIILVVTSRSMMSSPSREEVQKAVLDESVTEMAPQSD